MTNVNAATIRTAYAAGEFTAPDEAVKSLTAERGRLHTEAIAAYEAATGNTYAKAKPVERKVTLSVLTDTKSGKRKMPRKVSLAEVRRLVGEEGKRGRISKESLARAAEALSV